MDDAMVVARMTREKKESVAAKLADMGTNASQVVNQLWDYIDATGKLPFADVEQQPRAARTAAAAEWVRGLATLGEGNRFQTASDEDIRAARLHERLARAAEAK